jgi:hypothetical protein
MTTDSILLYPPNKRPTRPRRHPHLIEEYAVHELQLQTVEAPSAQSPAPGSRGSGIPADEWQRRFMAHIHAVSGFNVNAAATWPEGYAGLSKGYEADPEGAANVHLSYWLD